MIILASKRWSRSLIVCISCKTFPLGLGQFVLEGPGGASIEIQGVGLWKRDSLQTLHLQRLASLLILLFLCWLSYHEGLGMSTHACIMEFSYTRLSWSKRTQKNFTKAPGLVLTKAVIAKNKDSHSSVKQSILFSESYSSLEVSFHFHLTFLQLK